MDIGYHFDLTTILLREHGYGTESINLALFANGLTDLLGNLPFQWDPGVLANTQRMHCDNLFTPDDVANYWKQLLGNLKHELIKARGAFEGAATNAEKDIACLKALYAIGIALHALQDLCSHSNWCQIQANRALINPAHDEPRRILKYNKNSVFGSSGNVEALEELGVDQPQHLLTGIFGKYYEKQSTEIWEPQWVPYNPATMDNHPRHGHGEPEPGQLFQNLDHQDRSIDRNDITTLWDEAYVTAYISGRDLLFQVGKWIEGGVFLDQLKLFKLDWLNRTILHVLRERMDSLFLWISFGEESGHWKGPKSGDKLSFAGALLGTAFVLYAKLRIDVLQEIFGLVSDESPQLVRPLIEVLSNDSLPKNLYDVEKTGKTGDLAGQTVNDIAKVEEPATPAAFRLVTITIHSVVIPAYIDPFEIGDKKPHYSDVDGGLAPELYVLVTMESADPTNPRIVYRERTYQDVACNDQMEFVIDIKDKLKSPWQIVHIVPSEVTSLKCTIQLFDDDDGLGFCDDELRINPFDNGEDNLYFEIVNLDGVAALADSPVTPPLSGLPADRTLTQVGDPVLLEAIGTKDDWYSSTSPANVQFTVTVAELKP